MSSLEKVIREVGRNDPSFARTRRQAIVDTWKSAEVAYRRANAIVHPSRFTSAHAYEIYRSSYERDLVEFQVAQVRAAYSKSAGGK